MAQLYKAFNISCMKLFRTVYTSFRERALYEELSGMIKKVKTCPETRELYDCWNEECSPHIDGIYERDESVLGQIGLFSRINMSLIYPRLNEEEREHFWMNVITLCRYCGMLSACGSQAGNMEDLAMKFVNSNPGLSPAEYHRKIYEDMLTGGALSQQLLDTFKQPGALKNIVSHFGSIMRGPGEEKTELDAMLRMIETEDLSNIDEEFAQVQQQIRESGIDPFKEMSALMENQPDTTMNVDDPVQGAMQQTAAMRDVAQKLAAKMMQLQKEKEAAKSKEKEAEAPNKEEQSPGQKEQEPSKTEDPCA